MAIVTSSLAAACLTKLIHSVSFSTACPSPRLRICFHVVPIPIGSMCGIYANIGGILMVNVTIYSIHGSYGYWASHLPPMQGHR